MRSHIIAVREANAMLREWSFILIILLEMLLVSSSGLLSVGYVILTSPESSSTLSQLSNLIYVAVVTDTPAPFKQVLEEGRINYRIYDDFGMAREDLKDGLVDAVIMGDITFTGNRTLDSKPSIISLFLPSNSPKTPLTKLALKKAFIRLEDKVRELKVREYAPYLDFTAYRIMNYKPNARYFEIYYIFTLPLLLFLPCVIAGSLTIDTITQDLESKRMLNLTSAPLTDAEIVLGKSLASLFLSLVQSALWLLVLSLTFVSPANHLALMAVCALYTVIFMNAGSILALHLKKMKVSQIIYTFFSMTAISLFSPFANIHPLLLANSPSHIITRIALGTPSTTFLPQLTLLAALAVASTAILYRSAKKIGET